MNHRCPLCHGNHTDTTIYVCDRCGFVTCKNRVTWKMLPDGKFGHAHLVLNADRQYVGCGPVKRSMRAKNAV